MHHRYHLLFLLLCALIASASAQIAPDGARQRARDASGEQRRAELRIALQAGRGDEVQATVGDSALATRHLSTRERAEMRQQLRQLQAASARPNP